MGIQQASKMKQDHSAHRDSSNARSCMAIIWVQNGSGELDRDALINAVKNMSGVSDAKFTRDKPAILMVDYCTRETKAVNLVEAINNLGAYARIVGC